MYIVFTRCTRRWFASATQLVPHSPVHTSRHLNRSRVVDITWIPYLKIWRIPVTTTAAGFAAHPPLDPSVGCPFRWVWGVAFMRNAWLRFRRARRGMPPGGVPRFSLARLAGGPLAPGPHGRPHGRSWPLLLLRASALATVSSIALLFPVFWQGDARPPPSARCFVYW